jgi:hypothetical protein
MKKNGKNSPQTPQGTIVLMIVFFVLLIALWGSTYLTLMARGGTF